MRLLYTLHFPLDPNSGAAGVTLRLADRMRALGHDVEVRGTEHVPGPPGRRRHQVAFPAFASAWALGAMRRGVDVIDASSGDLGALPRAAVRRSATAVFTRSHGLEPLEALEARAAAARGETAAIRPWSLYFGAARLELVKRSLRAADVALVLNHAEREWVSQQLSMHSGRVRVVANGVPDAFLDAPPPSSRVGPLRLAVMGPVMWRKGALAAGRAVRALLESGDGVSVTWLGAPAADVAGAVGRGAERVAVVPRYRQEELPLLLAGHHLLLFLSLFEGLPGSVIEAMACGLAVVGSDIPGVRDLVTSGREGVLVAPGDWAAAAEAVQRLSLDGGELQALRSAAWRRARDYGWDAVAARTEALYREVIASKAQ